MKPGEGIVKSAETWSAALWVGTMIEVPAGEGVLDPLLPHPQGWLTLRELRYKNNGNIDVRMLGKLVTKSVAKWSDLHNGT